MSLLQDNLRQSPTRPTTDIPRQPNAAIATEENDLQKELYSRALFLEVTEPAQGVFTHYSDGFWFGEENRPAKRKHHELAGAIKGFLDGMATFLGSQPGADNVTACALEVCMGETTEAASESLGTETSQTEAVASSSGSLERVRTRSRSKSASSEDSQSRRSSTTYLTAPQLGLARPRQAAYTVTLRIAMNGEVPKETIDLAEKLLQWIRKADVSDAARQDLLTTVASTCWREIQSKLGKQPDNAKIKLIKKARDILNDCDYPEFDPSLNSLPVLKGISDYTYSPKSHRQAFDTFVEALNIYISVLESILESGNNTKNVIDAMVWAYHFRKDRVITYFLSASLDKPEYNALIKNFEKLGSYNSDVLHFVKIASLGPQHHQGWIFHSTTKVCTTTARKSHTVAMELDDLASATLKDEEVINRLLVPGDVKERYQRSKSADMIEHCEMQLVRFYIENATIFPVIPYFGISKLACYCCDKVLKKLQHPTDMQHPGPPIEFAVRGTHGKLYSHWRPPITLQTDDCVRERVNRAIKDLITDLDDLFKAKIKEYVKARELLAEGPGWSSSEDDDAKGSGINELARLRNALGRGGGGRRQRRNK